MTDEAKFYPLGENALTINLGSTISIELNEKVISLANRIKQENFQGFREVFPAYSSLTIFYDTLKVKKNFPQFPTAFEAVKSLAEKIMAEGRVISEDKSKILRIPVNFDAESALDLMSVAGLKNLSAEKIIEIFTAKTYRVFMLGFLPGFAYMGEIDERISVPRKNSPRQNVPPGSVGIAGQQTGVYPSDSPGGWQIIGRTELKLFNAENDPPTFFQPGDSVMFYAV